MIAAVWLPDFYLQAWGRFYPDKSQSAIGLIDSGELRGAARLLAANDSAIACGVRAGMTLAQARVIISDIIIATRCPNAEAQATEALRDVLWGRSPQVRMDDKDTEWSYLGLSGLTKLFGDVNDWVQAAYHDLEASGFRAQIGVAPGWQQARVMAVYGGGLLHPGQTLARFPKMPCLALEPSRELSAQFQRLGMKTIGDFMKLHADDVLEHMGEEAYFKHQIVCGKEPAGPLAFERYEPVFMQENHFEEPLIDLNALSFALRPMVEQLLGRLRTRGLYCRGVHLFLSYDGAGSEERVIEAGFPTRSARVIFELCQLELERSPPEESVGMIRVLAVPCQLESVQYDLFEPEQIPQEKLALTVARLESVFGKEQVGSPRFRESYREDVFELVAFSPDSLATPSPRMPAAALSLRRFRPPRQAHIECTRGRLQYFTLGKFSGRIRRWYGPYRVCADWWCEHLEDGERGFFGDLYDVEVREKIYRVSWNHRKRNWLALGWYD